MHTLKPSITAILVAAGQGARLNKEQGKAMVPLLGEPLFIHSIKLFNQCQFIDRIIIVAREEDIVPMWEELRKYDFTKPIDIKRGGATRGESVSNGLELCDDEYVLLHDAARPCLDLVTLNSAIEFAFERGNTTVTHQIKGTIHRAENNKIASTVDRNMLFEAQTPQIFKTQSLKHAYDRFGTDYTDDAGVVSHNGESVELYIGRSDNIKITTPDDLELAEAILYARRNY